MNLISFSLVGLLPHTFFGFVVLLLLVKVFTKIRSHFQVAVNCWFCNQNSRVPYRLKNNWDCPHCGQYNGFKDDGDYNREISAQFTNNNSRYSRQVNDVSAGKQSPQNGLCQTCNDNQAAKMEKLAAFEPRNEKTYDEEVEKFELTLQDAYRLCHRCEKNLSRILAEKKKMILGLHLAQGVAQHSDPSKEFLKPSHMHTSPTIKILKQCTNSILFVIALANWINVIDQLRLNREHLQTTFGSVTASCLIIVISHLVAITKVIMKYCTSILSVHLIEKVILFVRTISVLVAYSVGVNLPKVLGASSALLHSGIPIGSMLLTFASHFWDGFKVTRKTYLLATWSAYNCLSNEDSTADHMVYKVLLSLAILILSLPSFTKHKGLQYILDETANSFHRIPGDDYYSDQTTLLNSTKSLSKSLNISNASSNTSFSPVSLGQSSCRKTLTSSVFNLCTTPVSAFRSYSTEQLHNGLAGVSNRSVLNPSLKSVSLNTMNSSPLRSPLPMNDSIHSRMGCSTPKSIVSCTSTLTSRRNLLSPSHFGSSFGNASFCTAYAEVQPQPMPNMYTNGRDVEEKRKTFIFNNIVPHESVSRESSQSSGFESLASSTVQPQSERFYSFDNSMGRSQDCLSVYSEPQSAFSLNTTKRANSLFDFEPRRPVHSATNNRTLQNNMDFASSDHWVRNSPMDMRESFRPDYFADHAIDRTIKSNAFDLNGMTSFLPPVRKRYNLLGNLRNNLGSHEELHVET